jgi:hypothetical protein
MSITSCETVASCRILHIFSFGPVQAVVKLTVVAASECSYSTFQTAFRPEFHVRTIHVLSSALCSRP